jgi:acyl-coenzyme A synthetase/AMP-(fatty) acid ligase
MIGNGLKPEVWTPFVERFKIPHISEFYGATEGNGGLINVKNRVGAIGYIPPLIDRISPIRVARFDVESEVLAHMW